MITTKQKYLPSVNINRDNEVDTNYIVTNNTFQIFDKIQSDYEKGIRAFNLIGAYGTGKSAFLLAFEKSLGSSTNTKATYFKSKFEISFEAIKFIGEHDSIFEEFASYFNLPLNCKTSQLFSALSLYLKKLKKNDKGLLIVIDEFGKFLEFAAKYNSEKDIFFLQQLAEFVNNINSNILLITAQHQGFSSYAIDLDKKSIQEWEKVNGRFKEIIFNEPFEQLIFLASQRLKGHKKSNILKEHLKLTLQLAYKTKLLSESNSLNLKDLENLLPLDIISAYILTISLQRYGQNERSLFSFIETYDELLNNINSNLFFNIADIYDYLLQAFHSNLNSKKNSDFSQWMAIKNALDNAERMFNNKIEFESAAKIIKLIGLLNIFCGDKIELDKTFIVNYSDLSLGIDSSSKIIKWLTENRIIKYFNYKDRYTFNDATDIDIELAINEAGKLIENISNVESYLNEYFDFKYLSAKEIYYNKGTPRLFAFKISESILADLIPAAEIDGYINLIFSEKFDESILTKSKSCSEAVLYGWFKNTHKIKKLLFEIQKVNKAKYSHRDDRAAVREFNIILNSQINLLNHYVYENIFNVNSNIEWYYKGKKLKISNYKSLIKYLSIICEDVYYYTPHYKNELVNKTKLTGSISTAKKNYFSSLINNFNEEGLGFNEELFPPEKTIYLSLLKNTGIHKGKYFGYPEEKSFKFIYEKSLEFINSTKNSKKNLSEFYDLFLKRPFKLKRGFLEFWIPTFLLINKENFALYSNNQFVVNLSEEVIELINKAPHKFEIKAFDQNQINLAFFNKYCQLLSKGKKDSLTKENFIQTITPFLSFYKNLPQYSKTTLNLNKQTVSFRNAIANSKDPERAFFSDFPLSLGYDYDLLKKNNKLIEKYVKDVSNSLKALNTAFPALIDRVLNSISLHLFGEKIAFNILKINVQKRYENLDFNLLNREHKILFDKLNSIVENKDLWCNSISIAAINKPLELLIDGEETILYLKIKTLFKELDNYLELKKVKYNPLKENIYRFEISNPQSETSTEIIRYPITRNYEINKLKKSIQKLLTKDAIINKAALVNLLMKDSNE